MKRLLGLAHRRDPRDATVGGIPVDSEYVIFIIDTSGSMHNYAWPLVNQKMRETLNIYPKVKGLQVMNDMGQHMFRNYAGRWIPDMRLRRVGVKTRDMLKICGQSPDSKIAVGSRTTCNNY